MSNSDSTWISLSEAAAELDVSTRTVRRIIARGDLAAYRLPGSRLLRLERADIQGLLKRLPTAGSAMEAF